MPSDRDKLRSILRPLDEKEPPAGSKIGETASTNALPLKVAWSRSRLVWAQPRPAVMRLAQHSTDATRIELRLGPAIVRFPSMSDDGIRATVGGIKSRESVKRGQFCKERFEHTTCGWRGWVRSCHLLSQRKSANMAHQAGLKALSRGRVAAGELTSGR